MMIAKSTTALMCFLLLVMWLAIGDVQGETDFEKSWNEKRSDIQRQRVQAAKNHRFYGGPRFGRSGKGLIENGIESRTPERFFGGSRYGKRSAIDLPWSMDLESMASNVKVELECVYYGLGNLYSCEKKYDSPESLEVKLDQD